MDRARSKDVKEDVVILECWESPLQFGNGLFNSCIVLRGSLYYFLNGTPCIIWHVSCGVTMMIFEGKLMGTWQVGEWKLGYEVSREGLGRQSSLSGRPGPSGLLLILESNMVSSLLRNCSRSMCSGNTVRGLHLLHQSEVIHCSKKLDM